MTVCSAIFKVDGAVLVLLEVAVGPQPTASMTRKVPKKQAAHSERLSNPDPISCPGSSPF